MPAIDPVTVRLFEALVRAPDGLDIHEIGKELDVDVTDPCGVGRHKAFAAIRALRLRLAELNDDKDERMHGYTVPIRRDSQRHVYFLTANREQGATWQGVRADTVLSRLQVDLAHWKSLQTSTDGRTADGRIARAYVRHFSRLIEDVQEIKQGGF